MEKNTSTPATDHGDQIAARDTECRLTPAWQPGTDANLQRAGKQPSAAINYDGPDESVECAYPGCTNRLRRAAFTDEPQFCSKEHRDGRSAASIEETAIRVAQLAGAKRIQADVSKALGLGLPLPSEIANLNAKYEAALDAFEAAWKEAHAIA